MSKSGGFGRRKYRNVPTVYNGIRYHSKREAEYAQQLDLEMKAGEVIEWQRQIPFDLRAYGVPICRYNVDFYVVRRNGVCEYVEVKGNKTRDWILKDKLFRAQFPTLTYRVIQ